MFNKLKASVIETGLEAFVLDFNSNDEEFSHVVSEVLNDNKVVLSFVVLSEFN